MRLAAIAGAALALRCTHLEDRPMHTDEAVHAVVLGEMLQTGAYHYNPHDSHGPALYYLSWPVLRGLGLHDLAEMEAWHPRLISALVGAATILLLAFWVGDLSATAMLISGVLLALAAPFVYYQRYFIHEGLFVLLSLALLRCLWSLVASRCSTGAALGSGVVTALLFATKETAPLVLLAAGLAAIGAWFTRIPRSKVALGNEGYAKALLLAALAFLAVFALLFSSFGTNPHGLADALAGQLRFVHRAGGEGHEKPWWTYFSWLLAPHFYAVPWSGWIVFGLAIAGTILRWNLTLVRLLFFFTVALGIIYSVIPYKTPWLEINILAPAILLAGVGAASWWQAAGKFRPGLLLLAALALLGLSRETLATCFAHPADARNPLAYSPTVEDVDRLVATVARLKSACPDDPANIIEVISTDYWPLPWYLRRLQPVGYWNEIPSEITGDIVITSPDLLPALQAKVGPGWKTEYFGLRSDVLAVVLSKPAPHE